MEINEKWRSTENFVASIRNDIQAGVRDFTLAEMEFALEAISSDGCGHEALIAALEAEVEVGKTALTIANAAAMEHVQSIRTLEADHDILLTVTQEYAVAFRDLRAEVERLTLVNTRLQREVVEHFEQRQRVEQASRELQTQVAYEQERNLNNTAAHEEETKALRSAMEESIRRAGVVIRRAQEGT
jgi:hypothetical protein